MSVQCFDDDNHNLFDMVTF